MNYSKKQPYNWYSEEAVTNFFISKFKFPFTHDKDIPRQLQSTDRELEKIIKEKLFYQSVIDLSNCNINDPENKSYNWNDDIGNPVDNNFLRYVLYCSLQKELITFSKNELNVLNQKANQKIFIMEPNSNISYFFPSLTNDSMNDINQFNYLQTEEVEQTYQTFQSNSLLLSTNRQFVEKYSINKGIKFLKAIGGNSCKAYIGEMKFHKIHVLKLLILNNEVLSILKIDDETFLYDHAYILKILAKNGLKNYDGIYIPASLVGNQPKEIIILSTYGLQKMINPHSLVKTEYTDVYYNSPLLHINIKNTTQLLKSHFSVKPNMVIDNKTINFNQPNFAKIINGNILEMITSIITDNLRIYIYQIIAKLNLEMSQYGKLIISGGDAFNMLVDKRQRDISPDIDTKFILNNISQLSVFQYFDALLKSRKKLWNCLTSTVLGLNDINFYSDIYYKILKPLEKTFPFFQLGVTFIKPDEISEDLIPFKKRYTLIPKNKHDKILFDIDLFCIDFYLKSMLMFGGHVSGNIFIYDRNLSLQENSNCLTIAGLLDIAFVRKDHLGSQLEFNDFKTRYMIDSGISNISDIDETKVILGNTGFNNMKIYLNSVKDIDPFIIISANQKYISLDIDKLTKAQLRDAKKDKDLKRKSILQELNSENTEIIEEKQEWENTERIEEKQQLEESPVINNEINITNYWKLGLILKYIAPPMVIDSNTQKDINDGIISEIKQIDTNKLDTGDRYDYENNVWLECQYKNQVKDPNCDDIFNIFEFRFVPNQFNGWKTTPNTISLLEHIFTELNNYIIKIRYETNIDKKNKLLGKMLYGYRDAILDDAPPDTDKKTLFFNMKENILIYEKGIEDILKTRYQRTHALYSICKKIELFHHNFLKLTVD